MKETASLFHQKKEQSQLPLPEQSIDKANYQSLRSIQERKKNLLKIGLKETTR